MTKIKLMAKYLVTSWTNPVNRMATLVLFLKRFLTYLVILDSVIDISARQSQLFWPSKQT